MSRAQAQAYCSHLARTHYENFSVATLLLPRRLTRHFHNVYAWCRWADDLGDETGGGPHALELLRWWRQELFHCFQGQPQHPVTIALADTIRRFHLPMQPFLDLLFAFEQDQLIKRYASYAQLLEYCRHSANPVGRLVLYLCEVFDEDRAVLADHICTALQLTNFWQDVARDFACGRIYVPEEDWQRFGYTRADWQARRFNLAFVNLMRFQVEWARDLFYRGFPLVERMPVELRPDIELFIQGGLAILRKIEQCNCNVWAQRPVLTPLDKVRLLVGVLGKRLRTALF